METYGRLGQPAMKLLHDLGEKAAGLRGVSRSSFVAGALRELSVGLCRGNFLAYRASLGALVRSSGSAFRPGLSCPPTAPWNRAVWSGVKAAYALHCRFVDRFDVIVVACR
jgi:hypothetical protein